MGLKSTSDSYGSIAVTIHWVTALLIVILIGTGLRAAGSEDVAAKAAILRIHVPVAVVVLLLTCARIIWWWRADSKPEPVADSPAWQERAARAVHLLFYVVILGMVASGIGMMVASNAGPILFGGETAALPDFGRYPARAPHGIGARLLIVLIGLHAAAAIYHQYVRRDGLLRRMWFGGERAVPRPPRKAP